MRIELDRNGVMVVDESSVVSLGPALPALSFSLGGIDHEWDPTELRVDGATATADHPSGIGIEMRVDEARRRIAARVVNPTSTTATLRRLSVATTDRLTVGTDPNAWRIFRNSYQSWAGTWTIGVHERDRDVPTRVGRLGVTDGRHRAERGVGHVRSDSFGAVATPGHALAIGFTTLGDAFGFVEVDTPSGELRRVDLWVDLDDTPLAAGSSTAWFEVAFAGDTDGSAAIRSVAEAAADTMSARAGNGHHPAGWCSWYYYFTKVSEADIVTNLDVLAADGRNGPKYGCEYVMVDDGHQTAIGDWLSTNEKFPGGMAALAGRITDAGFDAGIWWAPFIVSSRSRIAAEHPDWLVRNRRGRPTLGLLNPGWGPHPMWVLDTTHPDALAHITEVARTIGDEWGYRIQKIDFLFAAAHPGVRHDPTATRAQALRRGLDAVRSGAGDGFVLGCGSPLGPAVGLVDAMRIGADVTPSWTTALARTVGRDRHALATVNALLNTMTRSMLDGVWFLNDPDCLMVRDTDTKMTEAEVLTMCTVFGMTDGMIVLSDRMDRLPPERQALVGRTRHLTGGRVTVVDLFERARPGILVSRHHERVDIAVVNLDDTPRAGRVDLRAVGIGDEIDLAALTASASAGDIDEYWSGDPVRVRDGVLDLGPVAPHASRLVSLPRR